jgi:hypothetical protein
VCWPATNACSGSAPAVQTNCNPNPDKLVLWQQESSGWVQRDIGGGSSTSGSSLDATYPAAGVATNYQVCAEGAGGTVCSNAFTFTATPLTCSGGGGGGGGGHPCTGPSCIRPK